MDAVQEVAVQQNALDSEFGFSAGGTLNVSMKSGTNDFHGTGYYFGRNPRLNAVTNRLLPHLGRHYRRSDPEEQAVLLRLVRAVEEYPAIRKRPNGPDRSGACRRFLALLCERRQPANDLRSVDDSVRCGQQYLQPHAFPRKRHPAEPH
jgi:hypothetical protein